MESAYSLRSQVLAFTLVLVVGALLATFTTLLKRSDDTLRYLVDTRMEGALTSVSHMLRQREAGLLSQISARVADPQLQQAISAGDLVAAERTLAALAQDAALNPESGASSDHRPEPLLFVVSGDDVLFSNHPEVTAGNTLPLVETLGEGLQSTGFLPLGPHLYHTVARPLGPENPATWVGMGYRLSAVDFRTLLSDPLYSVTLSGQRDGQLSPWLSTLPDAGHALEAIHAPSQPQSLLRLPLVRTQRYISRPVGEGTGAVSVIVSQDLSGVYDGYEQMRHQVLLLATLFILLTIMGGFLIARRLTRPVSQMTQTLRDIAQARFTVPAIRSTSAEVLHLLQAFRLMSTRLSEREERIVYHATHDSLTGAMNRDAVTELIEDMVASDTPFLLIGVQIAGLKSINENLGLEAGDACLRQFADRLRDNSNQDFLARQSADELALIIPLGDDTSEQTQERIIHAVTGRLSKPMQVNDIGINPDFYTAVISYPKQAEDARQMWRRFSIALEHAISRNQRVYVYEEGLDQAHIRKTRILRDLKQVLSDNDGQLKLYYQPKMDLSSGRITKAEALIRWHHPELGFIPPDYFIELAEQTGLIRQVTRWVVSQVLRDHSKFLARSLSLQLSVNISASDLADTGLKKHIHSEVVEHKAKPSDICLEITERDMMTDVDRSVELLNDYRRYGFHLAIDDYGVGYSALSKLSVMPVDELKIDKSFILQLIQQRQDQVIVKSTIAMAHELGMKVVAEGVEDEDAMNWLADRGCDFVQGYYLSRALPVDELIEWCQVFAQHYAPLDEGEAEGDTD